MMILISTHLMKILCHAINGHEVLFGKIVTFLQFELLLIGFLCLLNNSRIGGISEEDNA